MKTQAQTREEFCNYWQALKDEYGQGAGSRSEVWEQFIAHKVEEGELPSEALQWKMPRSNKA